MLRPVFALLLFYGLFELFPTVAWGRPSIQFARSNISFENYYSIDSQSTVSAIQHNSKKHSQNSLDVSPFFSFLSLTQTPLGINKDDSDSIPLLHWILIKDSSYQEPPPYNRAQQFKSWIKDPTQQTCLNIRGLVLKRQAHGDIVTNPKSPCTIISSEWYDPYTDTTFHSSQDLQIDHVVPLKNAYLAGAWSWSQSKRCHYANFIEDNTHLIAVARNANEGKGDSAPDKYMPPNAQFKCQYLAIWLKIKAVWNLKISVNEGSAIRSLIQENNCSENLFYLSDSEFNNLQSDAEIAPAACQ